MLKMPDYSRSYTSLLIHSATNPGFSLQQNLLSKSDLYKTLSANCTTILVYSVHLQRGISRSKHAAPYSLYSLSVMWNLCETHPPCNQAKLEYRSKIWMGRLTSVDDNPVKIHAYQVIPLERKFLKNERILHD